MEWYTKTLDASDTVQEDDEVNTEADTEREEVSQKRGRGAATWAERSDEFVPFSSNIRQRPPTTTTDASPRESPDETLKTRKEDDDQTTASAAPPTKYLPWSDNLSLEAVLQKLCIYESPEAYKPPRLRQGCGETLAQRSKRWHEYDSVPRIIPLPRQAFTACIAVEYEAINRVKVPKTCGVVSDHFWWRAPCTGNWLFNALWNLNEQKIEQLVVVGIQLYDAVKSYGPPFQVNIHLKKDVLVIECNYCKTTECALTKAYYGFRKSYRYVKGCSIKHERL